MKFTLTAMDIALIVVLIGLGLVAHNYWYAHPTPKEYAAIKKLPQPPIGTAEAAGGSGD